MDWNIFPLLSRNRLDKEDETPHIPRMSIHLTCLDSLSQNSHTASSGGQESLTECGSSQSSQTARSSLPERHTLDDKVREGINKIPSIWCTVVFTVLLHSHPLSLEGQYIYKYIAKVAIYLQMYCHKLINKTNMNKDFVRIDSPSTKNS